MRAKASSDCSPAGVVVEPSAPLTGPISCPPPPSSSGKRYYVHLLASQSIVPDSTPFVSAGHLVAVQYLGGSWFSGGCSPKGFASLEEAVAHLLEKSGHEEATIRFTFKQ